MRHLYNARTAATAHSWRQRRRVLAAGLPTTTLPPNQALVAKAMGNECFAKGDMGAALAHYQHGQKLLLSGHANAADPELRCILWSNAAQCFLELGDWWEAAFAAHIAWPPAGGVACTTIGRQELKAAYRYALATSHLGLLTTAEALLDDILARSPSGSIASAARPQLAKVRSRLADITDEAGSSRQRAALRHENAALESALGASKAFEVRQMVEVNTLSQEGVQELVRMGMLQAVEARTAVDNGDSGHADPEYEQAEAEAARVFNDHGTGCRPMISHLRILRALHRALLYSTKKELQRGITLRENLERSRKCSGEGIGEEIPRPVAKADAQAACASPAAEGRDLSGGGYHCVLPAELASPNLPDVFAPQHIATLRRDRLVIVDGLLPSSVISKAREDAHELCYERRLMRTDHDDLCNPLQKSTTLPLHTRELKETLRQWHPGIHACVRCMWQLAAQLEQALELQLRVPQKLLVAAYPKGAHYRRHCALAAAAAGTSNAAPNPQGPCELLRFMPRSIRVRTRSLP